MLRYKTILGSTIAILVLTGVTAMAWNPGSQAFDLSWNTNDAGGVIQSTGGGFELSASIGQSDAGALAGGNFEMTTGFWFASADGDGNADGVIDLQDYESFQACVTSPNGATVSPECAIFDFNDDNRVDMRDFASLQLSFQGS